MRKGLRQMHLFDTLEKNPQGRAEDETLCGKSYSRNTNDSLACLPDGMSSAVYAIQPDGDRIVKPAIGGIVRKTGRLKTGRTLRSR